MMDRVAVWLNPGKNTEEIKLSESSVIWSNGQTSSPPNGAFVFKGDTFLLAFSSRGNEEALRPVAFRKVPALVGVYRSIPDLNVMCIFHTGFQTLYCDGPLRKTIDDMKVSDGVAKAYLWFHPGKDVAVVLVTHRCHVVYISKDGVAGPPNGEASIVDANGDATLKEVDDGDYIRLFFHSGGEEGQEVATYLSRLLPFSPIFRVDGYEQNGCKIDIGPDCLRQWDCDIVAIEVDVAD